MLHVKEAEGNSHAVILMKNGNQVHSEHMNKGRRGNQLLKAQSLQYNTIHMIYLEIMPRLSNNFTPIITECYAVFPLGLNSNRVVEC